jgi:hypothetical protein
VRRLGKKRAIVTGAVGGIARPRPKGSCRGSCKSARGRVERVRQALAVGFARSRPERSGFWGRAQPLVGYPPWLPVTAITIRGRRLMLWEPLVRNGRTEGALPYRKVSPEEACGSGDPRVEAATLANLAVIHGRRGDYATTRFGI